MKGLKFNQLLPPQERKNVGIEREEYKKKFIEGLNDIINLIKNKNKMIGEDKDEFYLKYGERIQTTRDILEFMKILQYIDWDEEYLIKILKYLYEFYCCEERHTLGVAEQAGIMNAIIEAYRYKLKRLAVKDKLQLDVEPVIDTYLKWNMVNENGKSKLISCKENIGGERAAYKSLIRDLIQIFSPYYVLPDKSKPYNDQIIEKFKWVLDLNNCNKYQQRAYVLFLHTINPRELTTEQLDYIIKNWRDKHYGLSKVSKILILPAMMPTKNDNPGNSFAYSLDETFWFWLFRITIQTKTLPKLTEESEQILFNNIWKWLKIKPATIAVQDETVAKDKSRVNNELMKAIAKFLAAERPSILYRLLEISKGYFGAKNQNNTVPIITLIAFICEEMVKIQKYADDDDHQMNAERIGQEELHKFIDRVMVILHHLLTCDDSHVMFYTRTIFSHLLRLDGPYTQIRAQETILPVVLEYSRSTEKLMNFMIGTGFLTAIIATMNEGDPMIHIRDEFDALLPTILEYVSNSSIMMSSHVLTFVKEYLSSLSELDNEIHITCIIQAILRLCEGFENDDVVSSINTDDLSFEKKDKKDSTNPFAMIFELISTFMFSKITNEKLFTDLITKPVIEFIEEFHKPNAVKPLYGLLTQVANYSENDFTLLWNSITKSISLHLHKKSMQTGYFFELLHAIVDENPHIQLKHLEFIEKTWETFQSLPDEFSKKVTPKMGKTFRAIIDSCLRCLPYHLHQAFPKRYVPYKDVKINWKIPTRDEVDRVELFVNNILYTCISKDPSIPNLKMMQAIIRGIQLFYIEPRFNDEYSSIPLPTKTSLYMTIKLTKPTSMEICDYLQTILDNPTHSRKLKEEVFNVLEALAVLPSFTTKQRFIERVLNQDDFSHGTLAPKGEWLPVHHFMKARQIMQCRDYISGACSRSNFSALIDRILNMCLPYTAEASSIRSGAQQIMESCLSFYFPALRYDKTKLLLDQLCSLFENNVLDMTILKYVEFLCNQQIVFQILSRQDLMEQTLDIIFNRGVQDPREYVQMSIKNFVLTICTIHATVFDGSLPYKVPGYYTQTISKLLFYRNDEKMPLIYKYYANILLSCFLFRAAICEEPTLPLELVSAYLNPAFFEILKIPDLLKLELPTLTAIALLLAPKLENTVSIEPFSIDSLNWSTLIYSPFKDKKPDVLTCRYTQSSTTYSQAAKSILTPQFLSICLFSLMEGSENPSGKLSTLTQIFFHSLFRTDCVQIDFMKNYTNNIFEQKMIQFGREQNIKYFFHINGILEGSAFANALSPIPGLHDNLITPNIERLFEKQYQGARNMVHYLVITLSMCPGSKDWLLDVLLRVYNRQRLESVNEKIQTLLILSIPFQICRHLSSDWYARCPVPIDISEAPHYHLERKIDAFFASMYFGIHFQRDLSHFQTYLSDFTDKASNNPFIYDQLISFIEHLFHGGVFTSKDFSSVLFQSNVFERIVSLLSTFQREGNDKYDSKQNWLDALSTHHHGLCIGLFKELDLLDAESVRQSVYKLCDLINRDGSPIKSNVQRLKMVSYLATFVHRQFPLLHVKDSALMIELITRIISHLIPNEKSIMVLNGLSSLLSFCISTMPHDYQKEVFEKVKLKKKVNLHRIFLIRSLIDAFPFSLPQFVADALVSLLPYTTMAKYREISLKCFKSFWVNHQDRWSVESNAFSPDDRDEIEQVSAGHSYYA